MLRLVHIEPGIGQVCMYVCMGARGVAGNVGWVGLLMFACLLDYLVG